MYVNAVLISVIKFSSKEACGFRAFFAFAISSSLHRCATAQINLVNITKSVVNHPAVTVQFLQSLVTVNASAPSRQPMFTARSTMRLLVSSSIRFPFENAIFPPHFVFVRINTVMILPTVACPIAFMGYKSHVFHLRMNHDFCYSYLISYSPK